MVGIIKSTVRRVLKQAHLGREWWSYACRLAGHLMREKVLGREWPHPLFGQLAGIWKSHDKAQAKSLDDRGSVAYLLGIKIWQSGTTRIMQDGIVVKDLAPKRLDPARYHLNPSTDLNELKKGMPWRTIQDKFGKVQVGRPRRSDLSRDSFLHRTRCDIQAHLCCQHDAYLYGISIVAWHTWCDVSFGFSR